jgi:hypothetical protein
MESKAFPRSVFESFIKIDDKIAARYIENLALCSTWCLREDAENYFKKSPLISISEHKLCGFVCDKRMNYSKLYCLGNLILEYSEKTAHQIISKIFKKQSGYKSIFSIDLDKESIPSIDLDKNTVSKPQFDNHMMDGKFNDIKRETLKDWQHNVYNDLILIDEIKNFDFPSAICPINNRKCEELVSNGQLTVNFLLNDLRAMFR